MSAIPGVNLSEADVQALAWRGLPADLLALRRQLDEPDVWSGPPGAGGSRGLPIRLSGLGKHYGARAVLSGIDLAIRPGEFVAVVGRSGCGKSTLLRLLAGLEPPSAGALAFTAGDAAAGKAPDRLESDAVRIMFQDARLLPWKRVIDNVALGLDEVGARERAREALEQVGLADRAQDWPAVLSGGQRQRVALARALVHRPRLLLLDEPLGALDALTRIEMHRLIESLWQQHGFTALLVTHDVSEAVALADRVLLIEDGHVALDQSVNLPRPRPRGSAAFAELEDRVLRRVLNSAPAGPEAERDDRLALPALGAAGLPLAALRFAI